MAEEGSEVKSGGPSSPRSPHPGPAIAATTVAPAAAAAAAAATVTATVTTTAAAAASAGASSGNAAAATAATAPAGAAIAAAAATAVTTATSAATTGASGSAAGNNNINNNNNNNNNNNSVIKAASPRSPRQLRRVKLSEQQLDDLSKDELTAKWREQDSYVDFLESQTTALEGDVTSLRESEEKYRQQYAEASHREKILVRRLASKEQELQEYVNQLTEMKATHAPSAAALRSTLLDPAVNILIQKLRQELITTKAKLEDTQNELSAWKFTPDSNTGKRLMAKCRLLYQENEELGRMISSGRIAKLEGELALQKSYSEEVKKSQSELDEFLQDLDEDVEGMQSTIYFLQQELRKARESVTLLQQENATLKSSVGENNLTNGLSPHTPPIKKEESEENVAADVKPIKGEDSDRYKGARTPPLPPESSAPSERASVDIKPERTDNRTEQNDESSSDSAALIIKVENELLSEREEEDESRPSKRTLRTKSSSSSNRSSGKTNGEEVLTRTTRGRDKTKRDKSVPGSDDERVHKKKRRASLLSLECSEGAEEDSLLMTNGEMQSDPE